MSGFVDRQATAIALKSQMTEHFVPPPAEGKFRKEPDRPPKGCRMRRTTLSLESRGDVSSAVAVSITVSSRTMEICQRLLHGKTDAEIALELGVSPRTVSNALSKLYDKVGVSSRAHVAHLVSIGRIRLDTEGARRSARGR